MKRNKNYIVILVLMVLLGISIGYSTFATQMNLNASTDVVGEWDVRITNVVVQNFSEGCDPGVPQYTKTSVELDAKLVKPGDFVSYVVTIKNEGTIDAVLANVFFQEEMDGSPAINYVTTAVKPELKVGEETTFVVTAEYIKETTQVPEVKTKKLTGVVEYVQRS